eukprot:scaffold997_cov250-Ochromonas_danica.AAC.2
MRLLSFIRGLTNRGSSEARIIVLGLDNAGKSTILARLSEEEITTIRPTHGFVVKSLKHENIRLNVWDVGGQKSVRPFWRNYFNDTDGLVNSSDRHRMEETGVELQYLLEEVSGLVSVLSTASCDRIANDVQAALHGIPMIIFANKQDLLNALAPSEITQGQTATASPFQLMPDRSAII